MVNKLLKDAAARLKKSDTPMLDARVLLSYAMGKERAELIFKEPTNEEKSLFDSYLLKREQGVPVAYIIGEKEFMGLRFKLNKSTLIPRPDTECLVERVIEENTISSPEILDLCTGSGCIGISLAHFIKESYVSLTDISEDALSLASENALINNVSERTDTFKLDVLSDKIEKTYDIIVSNPPYIKSDVMENLEVARYEPRLALDGGGDGLLFYREIIRKACDALKTGGMLALEIGYDQRQDVENLLTGFSNVKVFRDYGDNDRVVIAIK